ncbi:MAG: YraN family protein [Desulfurobacteriaceae bacterium]
MGKSQEKGKEGERIAFRYLLEKGYSIIRRNYKSCYGEIDIVAYDPSTETVVFVEVKLRKEGSAVNPLEAVTPVKQERIKKTALYFLSEEGVAYQNIRFDVIAVEGEEVNHVENAF